VQTQLLRGLVWQKIISLYRTVPKCFYLSSFPRWQGNASKTTSRIADACNYLSLARVWVWRHRQVRVHNFTLLFVCRWWRVTFLPTPRLGCLTSRIQYIFINLSKFPHSRGRLLDNLFTWLSLCRYNVISSSIDFTSPPGIGAKYCDQRICVSVCLSVCPLAFLKLTFKFLRVCMLPMAVVQPSSDDKATRYVLPVLWMTSRFHMMEQMGRIKDNV